MTTNRRTTARTARAFTVSRVGRALALATKAPTNTHTPVRYPSTVDRMTDKQVTAQFAMMVMHAAPWGEA